MPVLNVEQNIKGDIYVQKVVAKNDFPPPPILLHGNIIEPHGRGVPEVIPNGHSPRPGLPE